MPEVIDSSVKRRRRSPKVNVVDYFWSRTGCQGECVVWLGGTDRSGYGVYRYKGRAVKSHRLAWELYNGPIPNGKVICHTCDNPPCVKIDHLWLGTIAENNWDKEFKGRGRPHKGEKNSRAILVDNDVREIRRLHIEGWSARKIAGNYGVSRHAIRRIVAGRGWSHVV